MTTLKTFPITLASNLNAESEIHERKLRTRSDEVGWIERPLSDENETGLRGNWNRKAISWEQLQNYFWTFSRSNRMKMTSTLITQWRSSPTPMTGNCDAIDVDDRASWWQSANHPANNGKEFIKRRWWKATNRGTDNRQFPWIQPHY